MIALGVRITTKLFAYAVVSGSTTEPLLRECNSKNFPASFKELDKLDWLYKEVQSIISKYNNLRIAAFYYYQNMSSSKCTELCQRSEGVFYLSLFHQGIKNIFSYRPATLKKKLNEKGFNQGLIQDFEDYSEDEKIAIKCACTELN